MQNFQQLLDRWVAMWNTYDLAEVDHLFLDDARLTYFSSERQGALRGLEAIRKYYRDFGFTTGGKPVRYILGLENLQIDRFGELAIATGLWCYRREETPVQRGPATFVMIAGEEGCKLVHLHFATYRQM